MSYLPPNPLIPEAKMYFRYFRARPIGLLSGLGLVLEIVARVSALGVD